MEDIEIKGRFIVIEGPDASGRSTQIELLSSKLEFDGHAVLNAGLRRSELIGQGILEAKRNFVLGRKTISLFYAADFADQLENKIDSWIKIRIHGSFRQIYLYTNGKRSSMDK